MIKKIIQTILLKLVNNKELMATAKTYFSKTNDKKTIFFLAMFVFILVGNYMEYLADQETFYMLPIAMAGIGYGFQDKIKRVSKTFESIRESLEKLSKATEENKK